MYKSFEKNNEGKDYIVGDVHGEFKELELSLKKIKFNPKVDRLFSVGDLVNRGKNSEKIFEWMHYDWFFPISGNHEKMVLDILRNPNSIFAHKFTTQLGKWLLNLNNKEKNILSRYFESLPVLQSVVLNNGKLAGIVHAHIPFESWKDTVDNINDAQVQNYCLSTTDSIHLDENENIIDLEILFVGHMAQKKIIHTANTMIIDTGSGYPNRKLSILDMNSQKKVN